ncbi:hypothetical protein B7494_g6034 [Chlorociboria aeruginascens]|nr:hypothetical protein B7494_g6034 [Chlorociboria aeruginascens]
MSENEDTSLDTGYSTPVPELDDHRHHVATVHRPNRSRCGTVETTNNVPVQHGIEPNLAHVNNSLLRTIARDFEEAVIDEESSGISPHANRTMQDRSRRGTVTTIDHRSISPPNSVKAFANARRRERQLSTCDPNISFTESRLHDDNELHRTISSTSNAARCFTNVNDNDTKSLASSSKTAEEDVCFPLHESPNKTTLQIDFETLEDFIAEEEVRSKTPPKNQPQARIFHDRARKGIDVPTIVTSDGDFLGTLPLPSSSSSLDEKHASVKPVSPVETREHVDTNRFEYFSSRWETSVHAAELGGLILPNEGVRDLFYTPSLDDSDGVWWLNMNNPTDEEIRAICKAFGVHPLTIEDIGTQEAREKIELFPSYYFACFRSFHVVEDGDGQEYQPFNIYVVVFREGTLSFSFSQNTHAAHVRKRITMLKDYLSLSSDWICYALIDDIVDCFAPIITKIEQETDIIEDQVFIARSDDMHTFLRKIGMVRKNVMGLMKLLGGKADVLKGFTKRCNGNYSVTPHMDIGLYLGDIQDHVVTMMTSLAHFEKMLSRSHSNYLAQLSIDNITQGNKSNKVLSKITLLASVLVPLNLVCGMFGMNVNVPFGNSDSLAPFFIILGCLVLFTIAALAFAKRYRYI